MKRTTRLALFLSLILLLSACEPPEAASVPTAIPLLPTATPFVLPIATATPAPAELAATPTAEPTAVPTAMPTEEPTLVPTAALTTTEIVTASETLTTTESMTATATVTATKAMTATATPTAGAEITATTETTTAVESIIQFVGVYTASLPAASSPGRAVTLTLTADGVVTLTTDYLNNEPPIVEVGEWTVNDDDTATVTLTGQADQAYDEPVVIQFAQEKGLLVAVEYDRSRYGEEGLQLEKQRADVDALSKLVGVVWQLTQIAYSNDTSVTPDDPTKYTLEFLPTGRLAVRADCNRGMGPYATDGSSLTLGPLAFTRALCPPESLFDEYSKNLTIVSSYILEEDVLYLAMSMDVGIMHFAPAE